MRPPQIEKGAAGNDASDSPLLQKTAYPVVYRRDSRPASPGAHLVVHRLDSRRPELWEEACEARVSFLARQLTEVLESTHRLRQERDVARRQVRNLRVSLRRALGAI